MKVSITKKGLYSITGLSLQELVTVHNQHTDFLFKNSIRIALLDNLDGSERLKLQTQEAVEGYWESLGLNLGKAPTESATDVTDALDIPISDLEQETDDFDDATEEKIPLGFKPLDQKTDNTFDDSVEDDDLPM